jgi:hypothetical protein
MFTAPPEAPTTTTGVDATLTLAANETMPVASSEPESGILTTTSPNQFSLTGLMESIPVFPSVWPAAPVVGGTAIQNTVAMTSTSGAGDAEPQGQAGNSEQRTSASIPGNHHVQSEPEAGPSTGNFYRPWYPGLRYGVIGGKKRRKL